MSSNDIKSDLNNKIIKATEKFAAKAFIDLSIDEIYISEKNNNLFVVNLNEMETWLEVKDSVVLKELSTMVSENLNLNVTVSKNKLKKEMIPLSEFVERQTSLYKKELEVTSVLNAIKDPEVANKFIKTNKFHKSRIKQPLSTVETFLGGGKLSDSLMDLDDLFEIITRKESIEDPHKIENSLLLKIQKIEEKLLKIGLSDTSFDFELREKFNNNKSKNKNLAWSNFGDYSMELNDFLDDYVKKYSEIRVYNGIQHAAKYAAISYGNKELEDSLLNLNTIKKAINDKVYSKAVSIYKENYEYQSLTLLKHSVFSKYKDELLILNTEESDKEVVVFDFEMDKYSAGSKKEADIIKELIKYCHFEKKSIRLKENLEINKEVYLKGGFSEKKKDLVFVPKSLLKKTTKQKMTNK